MCQRTLTTAADRPSYGRKAMPERLTRSKGRCMVPVETRCKSCPHSEARTQVRAFVYLGGRVDLHRVPRRVRTRRSLRFPRRSPSQPRTNPKAPRSVCSQPRPKPQVRALSQPGDGPRSHGGRPGTATATTADRLHCMVARACSMRAQDRPAGTHTLAMNLRFDL